MDYITSALRGRMFEKKFAAEILAYEKLYKADPAKKGYCLPGSLLYKIKEDWIKNIDASDILTYSLLTALTSEEIKSKLARLEDEGLYFYYMLDEISCYSVISVSPRWHNHHVRCSKKLIAAIRFEILYRLTAEGVNVRGALRDAF